MKRKKLIKIAVIILITGIMAVGGIGFYLFNMPHRDVQSSSTDYSLTGSEIVEEYLEDRVAANRKYLSADGNSKILEITGIVQQITENMNGQKVVLLKSPEDKAGVSATLTEEASHKAGKLETGSLVTIKGVIRSGAGYDEDLELFENVIVEKSDIVDSK